MYIYVVTFHSVYYKKKNFKRRKKKESIVNSYVKSRSDVSVKREGEIRDQDSSSGLSAWRSEQIYGITII